MIGRLLLCSLARHGIDRLARRHLRMPAALPGMDGSVTQVRRVDDVTGEKLGEPDAVAGSSMSGLGGASGRLDGALGGEARANTKGAPLALGCSRDA